MKVIAFANRLFRDLDAGKSFTESTADTRLVVIDAINGALQRLHAVTPFQSKTTVGSVYLPAAEIVTLEVEQGSTQITGFDFDANHHYRTIQIDGDDIDNQVMGVDELLHAYSGPTGTVSAVIYGDAVAIEEPYDEIVGDLRVIETNRVLIHKKPDRNEWNRKRVAEPTYYWVEPNARNQNPPAPIVLRFDTFPDSAYRLEAMFTLAPARVKFADMLSPGIDLPIRDEHVEAYLLPVARGVLCDSPQWANKDLIGKVSAAAETALARYEADIPRTVATPCNRVRTRPGY